MNDSPTPRNEISFISQTIEAIAKLHSKVKMLHYKLLSTVRINIKIQLFHYDNKFWNFSQKLLQIMSK